MEHYFQNMQNNKELVKRLIKSIFLFTLKIISPITVERFLTLQKKYQIQQQLFIDYGH